MSSAPPIERSLPGILLALTAVTGVIDAVSFLALGRVFTANMTGNVALLAFAIAGAAGLSIAGSFAALAAFYAGAVAGGRLATALVAKSRKQWVSATFAIEALLVLAAAATAWPLETSMTQGSVLIYAVIALTAFAMGLRSATVRKLAVPDLTTTVLTMTITGLGADSSIAGGTDRGWRRRVASIAAMAAGAFLGVVMLRHSVSLPLVVCAVVAAACCVVVVCTFDAQGAAGTA